MHSTDVLDGATDIYNRRLASTLCREGENDDEKDPVNCPDPAQPGGLAVLYFMGSIYLFLAIAIVCDEFFVPSLEVIADQWQISDDIAGATLMAAGGSAPELATSMIGTFTGSDIGFGTIVGSAVFNVLFVIAMCVLYTPEHLAPLQLTWWPLFRDCCCYVITLITLTIFFGVTSPGKIELWEAILQFLLYLVYCVIMAYNTQLQGYFSVQVAPSEGDEEEDKVPDKEASAKSETDESKRDRENYLLRPSRYRAGIYQLINGPDLDVGAAGVNVVSRIRGSVQEVFSQIDKDGVGKIRVEDIQRLLEMLNEGGSVAPESSKIVMDSLDTNKDGFIDLDEFTVWYTQGQNCISQATYLANFMYLFTLPLTLPLACTVGVRDVRIAGNEQWCYWVFFASVAWIGGYAYILVDWITVVGATIQVPSVVMGLTLLAAGTSVPDLLSSVVVAKAGKGDMAVSSSIGSNIFDVTVGLPLPWMLFNLIYGCPVKVFATNLEVSIIVLLGMVVAVVLAVMWSDWRLSKPLGVVMMVLYVLFVAQDVIRVYLTTTVTC
ncbi:Sodium/calcium exchanger protein-domain-containing protein [Ochromonadaceae sp. CCMP2298]|nr:Sodium/calcium exchanger protein-domain-containing protein [Ochromonadaceae sp. CCMP2298]